jgi:hypothetical protein
VLIKASLNSLLVTTSFNTPFKILNSLEAESSYLFWISHCSKKEPKSLLKVLEETAFPFPSLIYEDVNNPSTNALAYAN